jgi:SAM-dependent methyltransferase
VLYDWECRHVLGRTDQDVEFWRAIVASGPPGRVLELACGTGRVTLPLTRAGVEMVGLDIDPVMLAVAKAKRGQNPWPMLIAADMRQFSLSCRFSVVIVPYNSIQLLTSLTEVAACLTGIAAHLAPRGIAGFEVTDFQSAAVETEVALQPVYRGQLCGQPVVLSGSLSHDLAGRTSRYRRSFAGAGWTVDDELVIRSYRRDELAPLLVRAGLVAEHWWHDGPVTRVVARRTD